MTVQDDVAALWERRAGITENDADARTLVTGVIDALDRGEVRVAEVGGDGEVVVHEWVKHTILLSFRLLGLTDIEVGPYVYRDRIPLKRTFDGVRVLPGAIARWGSYCAPGVVLMPSFVNIGGYVDEGTMVDTWATVGSCAQIGKRVHLSGGVGIGGVLEPPNAVPVVVEDDAFVGSRSMVVDGARVRRGAKLGAGCILTSSTRVFDAETGEELPRGEAPERAVCVSSARVRTFPGGEFAMPCLLVLRYLEGTEHDKLQLNDVLRRHGVSM
ncbi:MAG TPA: 2,3,4,5-tetrahydropyridine-2,6-dicarboxylate N-succinyltransferase [Frankiaceae bacterium]|nr:2,3,4,5-tetrahydropyridine-2,6-dicarboxylate N-succinyltransferase [Frankiaceae bacterium]